IDGKRMTLIAAMWTLKGLPLCFICIEFKLEIHLGCVTLVIRRNLSPPIRMKGFSRWIRGTGTWGVGRDVWKGSGEVRVYRKWDRDDG
nr:hypothetical protein [Tanacetum cinerariifolium]